MGIVFDHVDAWTKLREGDARAVATTAADLAVLSAEKRPSRRALSALVDDLTQVAVARDELGAHDTFVLTSNAPVVQLLAYSFITYDSAPHALEETLEAALAQHPGMAGDHEMTMTNTAHGDAHRIVTRFRGVERRWARGAGSTQVQWVRPITDSPRDVTITLSTVIPRSIDEPLVLPLVDDFALSIVTTQDES
ncbi:hypothetical protein [Curtobacterium sp. MCSS17_005]|jgi:hypothetical protein|uniref:hypothetical protein n=1 Tax=Curtobacterium sp. MCSS17_005 TaxID=2175641 RepID=UPI000DA993F6|nr:hypothetical protein [Curtobacterium sp. MCSS17_005]WIB32587.1 hypothetical protein DEJ20_16575 [Curtobacterium sp. MCSS17_005]